MAKLRITVWNENVHEQEDPKIKAVYPNGIHNCIADTLNQCSGFEAITATLQQPEHGLTEEVLANTDVLFWWGHMAHAKVADEIVERAHKRVLEGMGLVLLHSGHYSKLFKRLMGTSCSLTWREVGERERVWVCNPGHPITRGIDKCIEIPHSEMYGEPFGIPTPADQVFMSWYEGGEVFRSGCTWIRGNGKIFYFSPGHESNPIYHQDEIKMVLRNAAEWAAPRGVWKDECPWISPEQTREKIDLDRA